MFKLKLRIRDFTMSVLSWLRAPVSRIKKDAVANVWVNTFITTSPALCENVDPDKIDTRPKREEHPLEVCLQYMKSQAYKKTYGDKPVWHLYVRNFKGHIPPKTTSNCYFPDGTLRRNNPCPICRDSYLMPHYTNVDLLKQFISPYGGEILDSRRTGVCQAQQRIIVVAIKKAQDYGYLTFHVPHRHYNYNLYNKK